MAVRASMAELITRVRLLIGDPAGSSPTFSVQELQDALDRRRRPVRYQELVTQETIGPGGIVTYLDYYSERGDWEANEQLVDGGYNPVTPATADRNGGHWTFATSQVPPVLITGACYDVYGAAADVLEEWAAKEKLAFDFSSDGQSFSRSQKARALTDLSQLYRRKQWPRTVRMERSDMGGCDEPPILMTGVAHVIR